MFPRTDSIYSDYRDAGFSVIPVREDGSKGPAVGSWKGYTVEPPSGEQCRQWDAAHTSVGIVCGASSGNLEVIDIDEPSLVRAFHDAVKAQDPALPEMLCWVKTPRRNESGASGMHLLYRLESPPPGNQKLAMSELEPDLDGSGAPVINPATSEPVLKPRTLIETRGTGGYVVGVGSSPKCHDSGNQYEFCYGKPLHALTVLTDSQRTLLMRTAASFDRSQSETVSEPQVSGYEGDDLRPGDVFAQNSTWHDILEPHGWQMAHESGGMKYWRRPGKQKGWSATTGLLSKQGNELFCVFSSNAHPFEGATAGGTCTPYSKFTAYAILNYEGDFSAAAKALANQGYGEKPKPKEREVRLPDVKTMQSCEQRLFDSLSSGETGETPLGLPDVDKAIGCAERGELVILGARPSHGKSLVALQMARAAVERGENVLVISEEMGERQLATRMIANRSVLEQPDWRDHIPDLRSESLEYWNGAGRMFVVERCAHVAKVENVVEQVSAEFRLSLILVDYAQLLDGDGNTRYEQVTNVSSRLKRVASATDTVVILLAQLNRDAVGRMPTSKDLKDSGQLEQDADVILLLYWPSKDNRDHPDSREYHILIDKNRNRATHCSDVQMAFHPETQEVKGSPASSHPNYNPTLAAYGSGDF